jgi:HAD superfamily hydrolase (TIGR01549 family)
MVRAVLFDLDDTLFDHQHSARTALDAVRSAHECFAGCAPDEFERAHTEFLEQLHRRVIAGELDIGTARRERFRRLFAASGVRADDELIAAVAAGYRRRYLASWRAVPGALQLLAALKPRARLGIVSNNLFNEQREKVLYCGFAPHVDALVVSERAGVSKPDPRIFRIALEQLQCRPDESVMIGDSWGTDVAGARAAGIRPIWFNRSGGACPDPSIAVAQLRALEPSATVVDMVFGGISTA